MNGLYFASVINSMLRSTTPILLIALGSAITNKVGTFNVALEGQTLIACFFSIVCNYFTGSVILSLMVGIGSGALVGLVVALLQVKYKGPDMVIGTSLNLLVTGGTTFLLNAIFHVRGNIVDPRLLSLTKINFKFLQGNAFLARMLENMTYMDYLCYVVAIIMFIWLYKTVSGFHILSVGINKEAADSLGIKGLRIQMNMNILSGALCGLAGVQLAMGQTTGFAEAMTSGRGYVAMAAASLAQSHPLSVMASSLFFGATQALGTAMQVYIPSQLTSTIPYICTILALTFFGIREKLAVKKMHK